MKNKPADQSLHCCRSNRKLRLGNPRRSPYLSSVAKSDAYSNQTANAQIQERNHARARRRAAQQNMTTSPEEEDCSTAISHTQARRRAAQQNMTTAPEEENWLTVISHAEASHRTAQQTSTAEPEEEDRLTVTALAEHDNGVDPEEPGADNQHPRKSCAQDCIKGSYLWVELPPPLQLLLQLLLQILLKATLLAKHILCQVIHAKANQSPSKLSSTLAKQDSSTSQSMPTNNRLQRDSDRHRTDPAGASTTLQPSPESVHEPLFITSKRQVLPLSWSKACRTPGNPSMAQVSRAMFVITLYHDHHHCHHHHHQCHHHDCYDAIILFNNNRKINNNNSNTNNSNNNNRNNNKYNLTTAKVLMIIPILLIYLCCVHCKVAAFRCDMVLLCYGTYMHHHSWLSTHKHTAIVFCHILNNS